MSLESELLSGLEEIQSPGTFASCNELPPCDPQINVNGVGRIELPLNACQAQDMIDTAHRAPYGRGSETIVDTSVRKTWELNPETHFEIENPGWSDYIQQCCVRVAADLGIHTPVSASLYKMLIYERGAMFKGHTDTEKIPHMFGTLVVSLPSAHRGGDVLVTHQGVTKTFKTSVYQTSYACWYSDVHHEILPVASGYRWVLTYNLVSESPRLSPPADMQIHPAGALRNTIKEWLSEPLKDRQITTVYSKLDHKYTQANISLDALKGRDKAQVQALQKISSELPVEIFLAVIEKEQTGTCEYNDYRSRRRRYGGYYDDFDSDSSPTRFHPLEDVIFIKHKILSMVNLDGVEIMKNMVFDEKADTVLQENFFAVTPEEDYTGYMGNSGPEATHWYRVTAVVIVPRDCITTLLMSSTKYDDDLVSMIGHFARSLLDKPGDESALNTLIYLYQSHSEPIKLPTNVATDIAKVAFQSSNWDLFKDILSDDAEISPGFFKWARDNLPTESESFSFETIQDSLSEVIRGYSSFRKQEVAVGYFAPPTVPLSDEIKHWVTKTHDEMLKSIESKSWMTLDDLDGIHLMSMVHKFYDYDYLQNRVVPVVESKIQASMFVMGFLCDFFMGIDQGKFPLENGRKQIKKVANMLVETVDVLTLIPNKHTLHKSMTFFFGKMFLLSHEDQEGLLLASRLCQKIGSGAFRIFKEAFHTFWLPFLLSVFSLIDDRFMGLPTLKEAFQKMLGDMLKAYILIYLGKAPGVSSLVRNPVYCRCSICKKLNEFLQDPSREEQEHCLGRSDRHHVHQKLDSAGVQCTHITRDSNVLVVRKVDKNTKDREEWYKRATQVTNMLKRFDQNKLLLLLGEADYGKISRLDVSAIHSEAPPIDEGSALRILENLDDRNSHALQPRGGVKRKIEEIDLTGDD